MTQIEDYDYPFPKELVALEPASPRDHARLFIYNTQTDTITHDHFYNLDKHLPANSSLVLNNTKVVPSRIVLRKSSGGKVVALFLVNEVRPDNHSIRAIMDRKVEVGEKLIVSSLEFVVCGHEINIFTLSYDFGREKLIDLLEREGLMPLPLYLKKTSLNDEKLREQYQTLFAQKSAENGGSSAAPTASLHFSKEVFNKLEQKHINSIYITLHVGMGTFTPITGQMVKTAKLHKEYYEISKDAGSKIQDLRTKNQRIVAVGTTVVRTLESFAKTREAFGETDIFIKPPYKFQLVNSLITNFHVPKSSLMMLVDAFLKDKGSKRNIVDLYKVAIEEKYRLFSFGDAMLIF